MSEKTAAQQREERLKRALRANLQRRKHKARQSAAGEAAKKDAPEGPGSQAENPSPSED